MLTTEDLLSLAGERALVTGASRGIGAAIADTLGRAGATASLKSWVRDSQLLRLMLVMTGLPESVSTSINSSPRAIKLPSPPASDISLTGAPVFQS